MDHRASQVSYIAGTPYVGADVKQKVLEQAQALKQSLQGLDADNMSSRAEKPREMRHHPASLPPEQVFEQPSGLARASHYSQSLRTSIVPPYSRCG